MSTLLQALPTTRSPERSYTPLGGASSSTASSPYASAHGAVIYPTRAASSSSSVSGSSFSEHDGQTYDQRGAPLRSESEETLSPAGRDKGKGAGALVMPDGAYMHADEDTGHDLGEIHRGGTIRANGNGNGYAHSVKGKEREWDAATAEELADGVEDIDDGRYPPSNGDQDAERRIQENLARFAARDMARRKAARISRQMASPPPRPSVSPTLSSGSRLSFMSRPMSLLGSLGGSNPRNSLQGLIGAPVGSTSMHGATEMSNAELPQHTRDPYNNPYDPQPLQQTGSAPVRHDPAGISPFADPASLEAANDRQSYVHAQPHQRTTSFSSELSGSTPHTPVLPVNTQEAAYGYVGPSWRGGAQSDAGSRGGEKWWHALCGWGDDLDTNEDGERDNQAGRTNPFE